MSDKKTTERVKVYLRIRPASEEEQRSPSRDSIIEQIDLKSSSVLIKKDTEKKTFTFDSIFDFSASQKEIYTKIGKPVVESVIDGFNGTIFAYGQTGTGKTHTMIGSSKSLKGIIPRCIKQIIYVSKSSSTHTYSLKIGFIQLYMEVFQDLIKHNPNNPILIREDSEEGVHLSGVVWTEVTSKEECLNLLAIGDKNRTSGFTNMNANSSRSHAIYMIKVEKRYKESSEENGSNEKTMTRSTLYLVDLAGSERVSKTKVSGNRLDEAKNINLSLLALGNVIQALSDGKSKYIPFRDSKLTRLLEQSLGGNSKTSMIVTIGPSLANYQESLSSLMFGARAMKIQNSVKKNIDIDYKALCIQLQAELDKVNDGKNINNIEYDKLIEENNLLKSQIEKITSEKEQIQSLLENYKKGGDVSVIDFNNDEFSKIKKYYQKKIDKQEQDHKIFTQEVNKLLLEQEEKINMMKNQIQELESINKSLERELEKTQEELEQEITDRVQRTEQMMNEIYELQLKLNSDKISGDLAGEELIRIIGNSTTNKSQAHSINIANKFRNGGASPRLIDLEQLKQKFSGQDPKNNEELNEKIKKYERIINNLEDELIEIAEKYNGEVYTHKETCNNFNAEIKSLKKQLVKMIKAYKKLEKKYNEEKQFLEQALVEKNAENNLFRQAKRK